jgi:fructose-bisphosphate aldolase class 1
VSCCDVCLVGRLSAGGQSEEEATINLNLINRMARDDRTPWHLSFSFGRSLQVRIPGSAS